MPHTKFAAPRGQFKLRLPEGMHDQIKVAATESGRSANSEIIRRLLAFEGIPMNEDEAPKGKSSTLTIRLPAEVRARLDELSTRGPYRISLTSIVERGIELAALELERLK